MVIKNNISSLPYNTFGLDVEIGTMIQIDSVADLDELYPHLSSDYKVMGGGSNILLTEDISTPLIYVNNRGLEVIKEEEDYVLVRAAAGEDWHQVVLWAVEHNYGGIENLSLIPGKCGAAPMQNIGAYGVELDQVLQVVEAYDLGQGVQMSFHTQECGLGYRTSHFKNIWKDKYIITSIILRLTKEGHHHINTSYGAISSELAIRGITSPTIKDVSDTVIHIRQSKLPNPKVIGNAGSFFKNPIVTKEESDRLLSLYPDMPHYPFGDQIKLAAGWLIDQCGWKGKVVGHSGTYKNQALVLVHHGGGHGREVLDVAKAIQQDVKEKYGVELEAEVNVW